MNNYSKSEIDNETVLTFICTDSPTQNEKKIHNPKIRKKNPKFSIRGKYMFWRILHKNPPNSSRFGDLPSLSL